MLSLRTSFLLLFTSLVAFLSTFFVATLFFLYIFGSFINKIKIHFDSFNGISSFNFHDAYALRHFSIRMQKLILILADFMTWIITIRAVFMLLLLFNNIFFLLSAPSFQCLSLFDVGRVPILNAFMH